MARNKAERIPELAAEQEKVLACEQELAQARAGRNQLIRRLHADGKTAYTLAKTLGLSVHAVTKILGRPLSGGSR